MWASRWRSSWSSVVTRLWQVCNMSAATFESKLTRLEHGAAPTAKLPWLLNLTQVIQVQPGSGAQGLHRDAGVFAWDTGVLGEQRPTNLPIVFGFYRLEFGATRLDLDV